MKSHVSKSAANHELRIQEFKMKTFSCQPLTIDAIKGADITTINNSFFAGFPQQQKEFYDTFLKVTLQTVYCLGIS